MGLIAREIERRGISTVNVGVVREALEKEPAPRNVYVRFRLGQVLGEPFRTDQQRAVLCDTLRALETIREPGGWLELPYRWRRWPGTTRHPPSEE